MFDGVEQCICIEPELDHYPSRSNGMYSGALELVAPNARNERMPLPDKPFVFIYMTSVGNRFLAPILNILKDRDVPVLAYIPDINAESRSALPSGGNINYLNRMIDLSQLVNGCCLAITHGGTLSASRLLKLGLKLLICPQDLEKAVLASSLVQRKLAYALNWFTPGGITDELMNHLLLPLTRPEGLSGFVAKYKYSSSDDAVSFITAITQT
jgi:UDP:flavonoid glycosyltransferase YjiC (YdhE family)